MYVHGVAPVVACAAIMFIGSAAAALLQGSRITISGPPFCTECAPALRVRASFEVPMHDAADLASATGFRRVGATAAARVMEFYVPNRQTLEYSVYDSAGRPRLSFGGRGQAGGKFMSIQGAAFDLQDSLFVYDSVLRRISVFAPRSMKFVRSISLVSTQVENWILLPSGQFVVAVPGAGSGMGSMVILSPNGAILRTIRPSYADGNAPRGRILRGSVFPDRFFVAYTDRYEIEEWNTSGTLMRTVTRYVEWFPRPSAALPRPQPTSAPAIVGFHVDGEGGYRAVARVPNPTGPQPFFYYEEVLDVPRTRVAATRKVSTLPYQFVSNSCMMTVTPGSNGTQRLTLSTVTMSRPRVGD